MTKDEAKYNDTVKKYVQQYAKNNFDITGKDDNEDNDDDDELSDVGSLSSDDDNEDVAGSMEV